MKGEVGGQREAKLAEGQGPHAGGWGSVRPHLREGPSGMGLSPDLLGAATPRPVLTRLKKGLGCPRGPWGHPPVLPALAE